MWFLKSFLPQNHHYHIQTEMGPMTIHSKRRRFTFLPPPGTACGRRHPASIWHQHSRSGSAFSFLGRSRRETIARLPRWLWCINVRISKHKSWQIAACFQISFFTEWIVIWIYSAFRTKGWNAANIVLISGLFVSVFVEAVRADNRQFADYCAEFERPNVNNPRHD